MIKSLQITKLSNPVYVQFMDYVMTLVQDKNPTALQVKPQHDVFSQKVNELKNLYKSVQASSISEKIVEADALRDQILTGIIKIVDGNTYHYQESMRTTSGLLQKNILNYGNNIIRNDYQTETAKIESLVNDWRTKPDLTASMNNLKLTNWITELENANNEFKRLYALRTDEYSQVSDENMQSKRLEVNAAYDNLCKFLNSHSIINNSPDYDTVISGINTYVDQYATLLKQKRSHRAVKPEEN